MEDVLEVYHRPYNPRFPVICMDEASKQLVGEVRQPLPLLPAFVLSHVNGELVFQTICIAGSC